MGITADDVKKIAKLARLKLTLDEAARFQSQLIKIIDSMAELKGLDTAQVPPTTSVLGLTNIMREDIPEPFAELEKLLANAPEREGNYFKVRKVIE